MKEALKKQLRKHIESMEGELSLLGKKITQLRKLEEEVFGQADADAAAVAPPAKRIRRDHKGVDKTAAFLLARAKPTTLKQVTREFGISPNAAGARLAELISTKRARRVGRGVYVHWNTPSTK